MEKIADPGPGFTISDSVGAFAVNAKDQVLLGTGHFDMSRNRTELWQNGTLIPMPFQRTAKAINDSGVVVGTFRGQPGYTHGGSDLVTLPPAPGFDRGDALGLNNKGDIVGDSWNSSTGETVATLWPKAVEPAGSPPQTTPINLQSVVPPDPGVKLVGALMINAAGQIVVQAQSNVPIWVFLDKSGPRITKVDPKGGPISEGQILTLIGRGFTGATSVCFQHRHPGDGRGTCVAPQPGVTDTSLQVAPPDDSTAPGGGRNPDLVDLRVVVGSHHVKTPLTTSDQYTYGLQVTGVSPIELPVVSAGDRTVIINGFGFESHGKPTVQKVSFVPTTGGQAVRARTLTVNSATQITATAPVCRPTHSGVQTASSRTSSSLERPEPAPRAMPTGLPSCP
jgi:hypothetical protein